MKISPLSLTELIVEMADLRPGMLAERVIVLLPDGREIIVTTNGDITTRNTKRVADLDAQPSEGATCTFGPDPSPRPGTQYL